MAKISLHPSFVKDSLLVFKQRGIKGLLFGSRAKLSAADSKVIQEVTRAKYSELKKSGARRGKLTKIDLIHKGYGAVFLVSVNNKRSAVVFEQNTKITNGPDLWLYLSDSSQPSKDLGNYLNIGLIHGNKGEQIYYIDRPVQDLQQYKSVIIYCKQFSILFSFALLT